MCAIDMFYVRFTTALYVNLSFVTLSMRDRDMTTLSDFLTMTKVMHIQPSDFSLWVWSEQVADDIVRITKDGEEIIIKDSYVHYAVGMELIPKSPYSSTENTSLHIFLHILGVCMTYARSKHARIFQMASPQVVMNGLFVGYCFSSYVSLKYVVTVNGGKIELNQDAKGIKKQIYEMKAKIQADKELRSMGQVKPTKSKLLFLESDDDDDSSVSEDSGDEEKSSESPTKKKERKERKTTSSIIGNILKPIAGAASCTWPHLYIYIVLPTPAVVLTVLHSIFDVLLKEEKWS